jgi:glycosyltransferase involved in cell wall biosynthesis
MSTAAATLQSPSTVDHGLRVCFVTETYPPEINGVAMTVSRLVKGLLARGHRVQLVRPRQEQADMRRQDGALDIVPQPSLPVPCYRELKLGLPMGYTLRRLWRQQRPDLVHIFTEGPLGRVALHSAQRLQLPISSSFHTNFHRYSRYYGLGLLAWPILAYLRRFHNRTARTLVPTPQLATELQGLGFQNVGLLARGVDTRLFSPQRRRPALRDQWGATATDPVALYVGRLAAEKNLHLVLTAFNAIQAHCPTARLVLVGDGPLSAKLRRRYPDIVFAGTRRGEDLAAHYASANIFLFPSLTETFGNVTLEAMASGLAVVAFDYAAAHCHIESGHNGLLAPFQDSAAFVAAAGTLTQNPALIQRLGREARRTAQAFDWEQIHSRLETIFLDLIRERSTA